MYKTERNGKKSKEKETLSDLSDQREGSLVDTNNTNY